MLKKIIFIFIFIILFGQNVWAINLRTPTNVPVLYVGTIDKKGNFSGWKKELVLNSNDIYLVFHIHSYANGGEIIKLKNILVDPTNKKYLKNREYYFYAQVSAENADPIEGKVKLIAGENFSLEYEKYSWAVRLKGPNQEENEHFHKLPFSQDPKNIFQKGKGVFLGNLIKDYRSNLLIYFRIKKKNTPYYPNVVENSVDGKCGELKNICRSGKFKDDKDTEKYFVWLCLGENGGNNIRCELEKIKKPINAICGEKLNSCKTGEFKDEEDNGYYKKWKCLGKDGGEDLSCSIEKTCGCSKLEVIQKKYDLLEKKYELEMKDKFFYTKEEKEGIVKYKPEIKEKRSVFLSWPVFWFLILVIIALWVRLVILKKSYEE